MHDVLDDRDLVPDEAEQLLHSGYPVAELHSQAKQAARDGNYPELATISRHLQEVKRSAQWAYHEPDDDETLRSLARAVNHQEVDEASYQDRLHGAWLGRCVANTMGKPIEGLTRKEARIYLRAVGQFPQTGYLPLLDELPDGVSHLHESAPFSSAGLFTDVPRDDDLDWAILALAMLERHGAQLSTDIIAAEWLDSLPFTQTFTAERAVYRNVIRGIPATEAARINNPYREWIGALIRADVFGFVYPGNPGKAAEFSLVDARLTHVGNGIFGELWAAALVSSCFSAPDLRSALETALEVVPAQSRFAEIQREVLAMHRDGRSADEALDWAHATLGHYNWVHTLNNAALISIGILWGQSFTEAVAITISGGCDTDSSAATVGSCYGAMHGLVSIPDELVGTTHVRVRSSVRDFDRVKISELASRTAAVRSSLK